MQEQELFKTYEVKNWDLSARIYKILAASVAVNILALLIFGQTNLLTQKGCDSPLVEKVCQVLDTVYVGSSILTTDKDYIDDPNYEKTELADADITWVDQTGVEKFKYPDGYRALANPELMNQTIPTEIPNADGSFPANIPGIPNPTTGGGGNLMNAPQVLPPANDNAVTNLPDKPFTFEKNPTFRSPKVSQPKPYKFPKTRTNPTLNNPTLNNPTLSNNSPNKLDLGDKMAKKEDKPKQTIPTPDVNPTIDKNETVSEITINKVPLQKLGSDVKVKFDKKEIDLNQNFTVIADGVLTKDGKLDVTTDKKTGQPKSRILKSDGDPQMVEIAKQAIAAVGDSGWLGYLRNMGVEKINFTVVQDNDNLQVIITSDFPTPERAKTVTSGVGGVISFALIAGKNGKELGNDEKVLLNSAKAVINPQNNKQFVLNFVLPKTTAQEMIQRKLNEPEKPEVKKQSTAQIKDNNQNTVK